MYLDITEAAQKIGVSQSTLRRWERDGLIHPARTEGGHRRFAEDDLTKILSIKNSKAKINTAVCYCTVNNLQHLSRLNRQVENMSSYCCANGYSFRIVQDIASEDVLPQGFAELITLISTRQVDRVVLANKNVVANWQYAVIQHLCKIYDITLETIILT